MNPNEIVKEIKLTKKCSYDYLAKKTGKTRASNISEMLKGSDMWVSNFFKLLDAMEYEIVIQPKKGLQGEKFVVNFTKE